MPHPFLSQSDSHMLACPLCGEDHVHLDDVYMAGRPREDGPFKNVHVNDAGHVEQGEHLDMPIRTGGRRHTIAVGGWCEMCSGRFAIEFRQHKGQTELAILRADWTPIN